MNIAFKKITWSLRIIFLITFILPLFVFSSAAFSEEGLQWGRFRFLPRFSFSETYTDNVFLTHENERDDFITIFSPKISLDFALAPRNYLTASYEGNFQFHAKVDNFKKDTHRTGIFWNLTTSKGSAFILGARADFNSIQPYSERDKHKDYEDKEAYADVLFPIGIFSEIGIRYSHFSERFKDALFAVDEYDRDTITLRTVYKRLPVTAPFIEYTFYHQNNNDITGPSTDFNTHILFIGAKWEPTAKLSGFVKAGYYAAIFHNDKASTGLAIDADVIYRFSDITDFKAKAFRKVVSSTRAARDTGDFYVSTGGSLSVSYRGWDPLTLTMDSTYTNNKFNQVKQKELSGIGRTDDLYGIGLGLKYSLRNWLSFGLTYRYEVNDTNFAPADYRENRVQAIVSFAL